MGLKKKRQEIEKSEKKGSESISDFAKKIGDYFNTEPQKEKVLSREDFNAAGDVYYATVSASYKIVQRILLLLLVFFIVFSIITNYREITFDNFFYLIRDFTSASDEGSNTYETLSYESDSRQKFTAFRGGIVSVSPSRISIFTATGRRTLTDAVEFSSPYAVASDRFVLVYDTAGNEFSIYNSFARVFNKKLEHPVKCATIADDGSFALVTESEKGNPEIRLYNKNFALKATIPLTDKVFKTHTDYILSIDLDSKREKLAVASYGLGSGIGITLVSVFDLSDMKSSKGDEITLESQTTYNGEMPICCSYMDSGRLALITDGYVRVLNSSLEATVESHDYSSGSVSGYHIADDGVCVSTVERTGAKVIGYDSDGTALCNKNLSGGVVDVGLYGRYIFLQTEYGVSRLDCKTGETEELRCSDGKMLIYNQNTAMVCGESKAEYLVFNR